MILIIYLVFCNNYIKYNSKLLLGIVMLDIKILIISSFFSLIILIIISLFFWYKLPQEKYSKYFAFFSIIFSIGQIFVLFMVLLLVGYFGKIQEFVIKEKN